MLALGERKGVGSEKKAEQGGGLQMLPLRTEHLGLWVKPVVPVRWRLRQEDYGVSLGYIVRPCLGGGQKHQKPKLLLPQTTAKSKASGVVIS